MRAAAIDADGQAYLWGSNRFSQVLLELCMYLVPVVKHPCNTHIQRTCAEVAPASED